MWKLGPFTHDGGGQGCLPPAFLLPKLEGEPIPPPEPHGPSTMHVAAVSFAPRIPACVPHTATGRGANPCGNLGLLRTMEEGRAAFLLPFCCQSSKVSPPRRVSPAAHRPCLPLPCRACPPASRALRSCFPGRPRLRGAPTVHSCARGVRRFPWGTPDSGGSPSVSIHDIACAFVHRNPPNSSLALTHTGGRSPTPTFQSAPG